MRKRSEVSVNNRYAKRPLVRLVELYVLHALDALSASEIETTAKLAPYLARTYRRTGTWVEILSAELEFPPNLPDLIRAMWARNQEIARQNNAVLTAQVFAEMFVDSNIPIDPAP